MSNLTQIVQAWALSHFGLVVSDQKIEQQAACVMQSLHLDKMCYLHALQNNNDAVVNATIDALTVQESYFFRDASLFAYLKKTGLPRLIKEKQKKGDHQITIWSAGCACCEEIYSIAMCLDQLIANRTQWNITLIATDIDQYALDKGKKGIFTQSSMRAIDTVTLNNYFESTASAYCLKPNIRDMVQFTYGNLAQMENRFIQCDLIFCRNVFIYLDAKTITSALQYFYDNLLHEGLLFLGPSDFVTYYHHPFVIDVINNIYFLKKTVSCNASSVVV